MSELYDADFYAWAMQQAALLRAGELSRVDVAHVAEEIESMGRSEKRELVSRLTVLLTHLLKWRFQAERRSQSWRLSVANTRDQLVEHLEDNPSLKSTPPAAFASAYKYGRRTAAIETGLPLDSLPSECPWNFDEAMHTELS